MAQRAARLNRLGALLGSCAFLPLVAGADVSVRLYWQSPPKEVRLVFPAGKPPAHLRASELASPWRCSGPVELRPPGEHPVPVSGRLEVRPWHGHLLLTLRLPSEEFVAAVLAGESSNFKSEEAGKAMAVAARSFAFRNRQRHEKEGFDFCDTTHCQDLRLAARSGRLDAAVEATEGEILWYQGRPAAVFYHKHCGGRTEPADSLWPESGLPYLRGLDDTYCLTTGRMPWRAAIANVDLQRLLGEGPVRIIARTASGRVARLQAGPRTMTAEQFRSAIGRALGWTLVRSAFFNVIARPEETVFEGYGAGHGVGLCQTGAEQRGRNGHNYREILQFYFPGTTVGINAQGFTWTRMGGERVEVNSTEAAPDAVLVGLADRAVDAAERLSGLAMPERPRIRVYPTVATYRDATGQPGWVAANTLGRTIRLQPLSMLRAKGGVEPVVLHEMLHLAVDGRAHPSLPVWFREGLVLYLAGPATAAKATARLRESDLTRAPDEARMRAAYAAARARVGGLAARHGRQALLLWLERGLPKEVRNEGQQR